MKHLTIALLIALSAANIVSACPTCVGYTHDDARPFFEQYDPQPRMESLEEDHVDEAFEESNENILMEEL